MMGGRARILIILVPVASVLVMRGLSLRTARPAAADDYCDLRIERRSLPDEKNVRILLADTISAFTVVNMSELEEVKTVDVRLKFRGRKLVAHPRGFPTELQPDAQGFVRLLLPSGEGVFVTVD